MNYCYLNDKIVPLDKAFVHIEDIGLLRGYSVFDLLRTFHGKPFLLQEHVQRLRNSAKALSLLVPYTNKEIAEIVDKLLKKNEAKDVKIRILLTGGNAINGIGFDPHKPTFAILIEPIYPFPEDLYTKGGKLITTIHLRHEFASKTTNYINAIALASERKKRKAVEVLYVYDNHALECSTSNFFIFKHNTLITPKNNILIGTTRNFVLHLVSKDFTIEERDIELNELQVADEVFITSTTKNVLPIVQIDEMRIGNGMVGPNTKEIMKKFADYVKKL